MLVFRAGIHKNAVRVDSVQKQFDLGLHCLSRTVLQETSSQIKCWFSGLEFTKMLSE